MIDRRGTLSVWVAAWRPTFLVGFALGACSTAPKLQARGEQCWLVTDCQLGLVCVNQPNGPRRCSSDLTPIVDTEDAASATTRGTPLGDAGSDAAVFAGGDSGGDASDEAGQDEPAPE
ncbi:MAG: hypothetical protein M3O46_17550 [Myxococcota bacterium]|nr:hypothetical protein [Myxococcota bacterium]